MNKNQTGCHWNFIVSRIVTIWMDNNLDSSFEIKLHQMVRKKKKVLQFEVLNLAWGLQIFQEIGTLSILFRWALKEPEPTVLDF